MSRGRGISRAAPRAHMLRPRLVVPGVIAAMGLLAGCATATFTPSGAARLEPWDGEVEILERLPAEGTYQLLGVVIVRGVELTSDERMREQLETLAAEQGGNAVVPQGLIRQQPTAEGGTERTLTAYVIRRL